MKMFRSRRTFLRTLFSSVSVDLTNNTYYLTSTYALLGVEKLVICSNIKEKCCLCSRTLDTWIQTEIHFNGSEKPSILCYDCANGIIKDVDQNSTEHETKELLQDVREYPALRKCKEDSFLKKYFKFL